jgi:hypothetical protein
MAGDLRVAISVGIVHLSVEAEQTPYSPDIVDDLVRRAVSGMSELLPEASAAGAFSFSIIEDDEDVE